MSRRYALFAVEGDTDQIVIRQVLKRILGLELWDGDIRNLQSLWPRQSDIVPNYSSATSSNIYKRISPPSLLYNNDISVVIFQGGGSMLISRLTALFDNSDLHKDLDAFALFADADRRDPQQIVLRYQKELRVYLPNLPAKAGQICKGSQLLGAYIFPDNRQQGVVENLVIECGDVAYKELLDSARDYVKSFQQRRSSLASWAPFDKEKALIASVVSLLKPGKTNSVSLQDNEWISQTTQNASMLQSLITFCKEMLRLSAASLATKIDAGD